MELRLDVSTARYRVAVLPRLKLLAAAGSKYRCQTGRDRCSTRCAACQGAKQVWMHVTP